MHVICIVRSNCHHNSYTVEIIWFSMMPISTLFGYIQSKLAVLAITDSCIQKSPHHFN